MERVTPGQAEIVDRDWLPNESQRLGQGFKPDAKSGDRLSAGQVCSNESSQVAIEGKKNVPFGLAVEKQDRK
jgi:hypothetical protein